VDVLPAAVPGVSAPAALGLVPEAVERIIQVAQASGRVRLTDAAGLNPASTSITAAPASPRGWCGGWRGSGEAAQPLALGKNNCSPPIL
jgi:hypothetical protein